MGDITGGSGGSTTTLDAETGLTERGKAIAQEYAKQFVAGVRDKEVEKRHKEMMMVFSAIRVDEEVASRFSQGIFPEPAPKKLLAKHIDGYIADKIAGAQILRETKDLDKVAVHPMYIFADTVHVLFSKKTTTPELVERFNRSVSILKANGTYDRITRKYLK